MSKLHSLTLLAVTTYVMAACGVTEPEPEPDPGELEVAAVSVSAPSTSLGIGTTLQLTATVTPNGATSSVTWSSDDEARLTVDASGLATAVLAPHSIEPVRVTATSTEAPTISGSVDLTITCGALTSSDVSTGGTLPEDTCYMAESPLSVADGTLTIEPGVVIMFGPSGSLSIGSDGRLNATGTMDKGIVFTSADPEGSWRGIRFDGSRGADNVLHYVTIENGGSDGWSGAGYSAAALLLAGNSLVDIQNSTISGSSSRGITLYGDAEMTFADNALVGNEVPAWLHPNTVRFLDAATVIDGNADEVVRVGFGNTDGVSTAQTWPSVGVPFEIQYRTYVEAALTLEPGVELEALAGVSLIVTNGGTLSAVGTVDSPIVFRGSEALPGSWKGLRIDTQSADNVFDHVVFEYGGSDAWTGNGESRAMVYLNGNSRATFANSTFRHSAYYALWVPGGGDISGWDGNAFTDNVRTMIVHPTRAGDVSENTVFEDNDEQVVRVTFGNTDGVESTQTWSALDVPWRVMNRTYVEAPLTIAAGTVIEFAQNANLIVDDLGSVSALGTPADRIVFRGVEALSAYWKGVRIDTSSPSNLFEYVDFMNAGSEAWFGGSNSTGTMHVTSDGIASLDNVTFASTGGYAAIVSGSLSCTDTDDGGFMYYVYSSSGDGAQATCPG